MWMLHVMFIWNYYIWIYLALGCLSHFFRWSIWSSTGVCTFARLPWGVETFSNVPPLSLHHQNGEGHLTHGAEVSRGRSLSCTVCLHWVCVWLWGWITSVCVTTTISAFGCLDFTVRRPHGDGRVPPGGFSGRASSFRHSCSCSRWRVSLLSLLEGFVLPDVIFRVVLMWHLELKTT